MWQLTYWYPGVCSSTLSSFISKSILTFFISWTISSFHRELPFTVSSIIYYCTDLWTPTIYLWVRDKYMTSLLRWYNYFYSSSVWPTMQIHVTEIYGVDENIHQAAMGSINLCLSFYPKFLNHLSTESEFTILW